MLKDIGFDGGGLSFDLRLFLEDGDFYFCQDKGLSFKIFVDSVFRDCVRRDLDFFFSYSFLEQSLVNCERNDRMEFILFVKFIKILDLCVVCVDFDDSLCVVDSGFFK